MADIRVENLSKIYNQGKENEVRALDKVSFSAKEGEFIVIIGPSGAGKSTLLNLLGGMDTPTSGSYFIGDQDVAKFNAKQLQILRREKIGFVFQFYNLMPNLTALENVALASSVVKGGFDPEEILKKVGLEERMNNFPSQLSGGEQQRVAIARALSKNPELLLCDGPGPWIPRPGPPSSRFFSTSALRIGKRFFWSPTTRRSPRWPNGF